MQWITQQQKTRRTEKTEFVKVHVLGLYIVVRCTKEASLTIEHNQNAQKKRKKHSTRIQIYYMD